MYMQCTSDLGTVQIGHLTESEQPCSQALPSFSSLGRAWESECNEWILRSG